MSTIWVLTYPGGISDGDVIGVALAEDGEVLCEHESSTLSWSKHDMIESSWKDKFYQEHYPEGYEVIWVGDQDPANYPGLPEAIARNRTNHSEVPV